MTVIEVRSCRYAVKTTLILHPEVARACQSGRSFDASIADEAPSLYLFSSSLAEPVALDLPQFDPGAGLVDVADRNPVNEALEAP